MMKTYSLLVIVTSILLICALTGINYHLLYGQQAPTRAISTTFSANGPISSRVGKFILAGDWNINVKDGKVTVFLVNITAARDNATGLHYHTFSNFRQAPQSTASLDVTNSGTIRGSMDVGFSKKISYWPSVPLIMSIKSGTVISIVLNDSAADYSRLAPDIRPNTTAVMHFSASPLPSTHSVSDPIFGLVKQFTGTFTTTFTRTETKSFTH